MPMSTQACRHTLTHTLAHTFAHSHTSHHHLRCCWLPSAFALHGDSTKDCVLNAANRPPPQAIDLVDEAASRVKLNLDQRPEVGN